MALPGWFDLDLDLDQDEIEARSRTRSKPRSVQLNAARAALAAALALALAGCPRVPPPDLSRDPSALLDQVRVAQERVQRVRGSARVSISSPSASGSAFEFAAAEKPDRIHLETLDFFGNPVAVLVAAGGRFGFHDARANVFYRGDATPENVSRLLPVVLPVEELVLILCGSAPLLPGTPLDVTVKDEFLLLTIGLGDVGQRLAIGEHAAVEWSRVRRATASARGAVSEVAPAYDLEFDDFRFRSGVRFPSNVKLDAPSGRSQIKLAWREDVQVNAELDPALFHFEPPRGARIVDLARGAPIPSAPEPPPR
jgi:hypothetical protein